MIFFIDNDGTVIKSEPSPVYQGSANANNVYLVAPFASNLTVTLAFKLPNGVWTERYLMTPVNEISGVVNEKTGKTYSGWQFSMPNEITQYYGTVTAQFYFYASQDGVIVASSAVNFSVGRGVPQIPTNNPDEDTFDAILAAITGLQTDLKNGYYSARAIYAWNPEYTYGANEIVFYPNIGELGAFVKSKAADNTSVPYSDGQITENWEEVVNFNEVQDALNEAVEQGQNAAAQAEAARISAENATAQATAAEQSATQAQELLTQTTEQANAAANSAASAKTQAELAAQLLDQFATYGVKINTDYSSYEDLPVPGNSNNIYFVPNGGSGDNGYDEWVWVEDKNSYEKIGTTDIDLSGYVSKSGDSEINGKLTATTMSSTDTEVTNFLRVGTQTLCNVYKSADGSQLIAGYNSQDGVRLGTISSETTLYGSEGRPKYTHLGKSSLETREIALLEDVTNAQVPKGTATPLMDGVASAGAANAYAPIDHRHPENTNKANTSGYYPDMTAGTASKLQYGICSTPAGTAAKTVACENFSLSNGARITVYFDTANTANSPTLNVNNTGAKPMLTDGDSLYVKWTFNTAMEFIYLNGVWICIGGYPLQGKRVGSVYISNIATSPATLFGGSWTAIQGQFLIGASSTYPGGSTGGAATHVHSAGAATGGRSNGLFATMQYNVEDGSYVINEAEGTYDNGYLPTNQLTGISRREYPGANLRASAVLVVGDTLEAPTLPPYRAAYMWYRTA